jgi:signal transduction histidine kinase/PAS domain-containing protein
MTAKREPEARRSRAAVRPGFRVNGAAHMETDMEGMAAASAAAERRAEEAERWLRHMRGRYDTLPTEATPDLAAHAAQLEATLDALADSIIIYDMDDRVLYMNAGARCLAERVRDRNHFAASLAECAAKSGARDVDGRPLPPEQWPLHRAQRGETLTGPDVVEMIFDGPGGDEIWISQSAIPMRDASDQITGVIVISRDVTERHTLARRARESAREAEARAAQLEAVFDAITDGVFVYDRNGRLLQRNPAARRLNPLLGQTEYLDRPFDERITSFDIRDEAGRPLDPRDVPVARVLRGEVLMGERSADTSMRLIDGSVLRVNTTGAPVRDADGAVQGAVIVSRDVTERRQLARRTQGALDALLAMAEALVEGPGTEEAEEGAPREHAVAQRLAALTCSVLGCSRVAIMAVDTETLLQHPIAVVGLAPEQERQWWDEQLRHPARIGEGTSPEDTARFLAGEIFVLDLTQPPYDTLPNPYDIRTVLAAPMRIGDQIVGVLSLDHSGAEHIFTPEELRLTEAVARLAALVVERERLLDDQAAAQARMLALEEINRRMNEFLGIAGHEMRTPLTSAKANVQIAERQLRRALEALDAAPDADPVFDGPVTPNSLRRLLTLFERTEQQMNRQQRLIDDLLDASRIQSGKLAMNPQVEDLLAIVREVVDEQRLLHPSRKITLALPSGSGAVPIFADLDRIGQILTNYLTNALKYSQEDAPVAVSLRVEEGIVRVAVKDEGPGIAVEEHEHVWEPFHRAPGVEVQSGSGVGLGLGLHISKTIVERHGGTVGVESQPGHGATFWFALPLSPEPAS